MHALLLWLRLLKSVPRPLIVTVLIYVIIMGVLLRYCESRAVVGMPGTVVWLCVLVGLSAIAVFRRLSMRFSVGTVAFVWSRSHFWVVGFLSLLSAYSLWVDDPVFSCPIVAAVGLSLLVVGAQLLLRSFLFEYMLQLAHGNKLGVVMAIVLCSLLLTACAMKGIVTPPAWFLMELLASYFFYKARQILPILVFFSAAIATPNCSALVTGLIAVLIYYALLIEWNMRARNGSA